MPENWQYVPNSKSRHYAVQEGCAMPISDVKPGIGADCLAPAFLHAPLGPEDFGIRIKLVILAVPPLRQA